ncbi:tape measure domain protein [Acetobacteraceae bacterium AT-5844]|nr:tape measure domain protein [Acetobacteraceae bacterium AT-5844]
MIVRELQTLLSFKTDGRGADEFDQRIDRLRAAATAAAAAIAAAFGFDRIERASDNLTTSMNRLGASTDNVEQAAEAYELLYTSARETGIAVVESTKGFMRFAPAMRRAGFTMQDTVDLLDGLQKGLLAAGAGTAETASVFTQLGQAVNSGVFQGEELNAFLENASPTLVQAFADALGIAREELKKLASEGKLTNKNVLPALIASARAGRDEFGRMIPTNELRKARTAVAIERWVAELDKAFQATRRWGLAITRVGDSFDRWRSRIPMIRDFINQLGGLEQILSSVAIGVVYLTTVQAALNGALSATIARVALLTAGFAAAVAAGLLLHDLFTWMSGSDTQTLFGKMFGPFDKAIGGISPGLLELKSQLENLRTLFLGTPDEAMKAWQKLKDFISNLLDEATANWPEIARNALGIRRSGDRASAVSAPPGVEPPSTGLPGLVSLPMGPNLPGYGSRLSSAYLRSAREETWAPFLDVLKQGLRDFTGWLGFRQRVDQPDGSTRLLAPGENMNQAILGSMGSRQNNVQVSAPASITVPVTVHATGVSGPEVAAGAASGVRQGVEQALQARDGALARQIRNGIPDTEGWGGPSVVTP